MSQSSTEETFSAIISGKPKSLCNRELNEGLHYENSSNLQGPELTSLDHMPPPPPTQESEVRQYLVGYVLLY